MFKILKLVLLLAPFSLLNAVNWAILPVRTNGLEYSPLYQNKQLNAEPSWDLAKAIYLYMKAGNQKNILPVSRTEKFFNDNEINFKKALTGAELASIAEQIDAEKLLLTTISYENKRYSVSSKIYYAHSKLVTDVINGEGEELSIILDDIIRQRFSLEFKVAVTQQSNTNLIIGLDANGKNYTEIEVLRSLMRTLDYAMISIESVDGYGKRYSLNFTSDDEKVDNYFQSLKIQGNDREDQLYYDLLVPLLDKLQREKTRPGLLLIVTGAPRSFNMSQKVRSLLRQIASRSNLYIFGNGKLTPAEREFWTNMAAENNYNAKVNYLDIIYEQKIGLSSGHEVYLFKKGDQLLENSSNTVIEAQSLKIKNEQIENFIPENLSKIFSETTGAKVVSSSSININLGSALAGMIYKSKKENSPDKPIRILLDIDGSPFWITVPYNTVYDNGQLLLSTDKFYYFFINLVPGSKGTPFANQAETALLVNYPDISEYFLLDIKDYLKDPQKYLNKSIGKTSFYLLQGKFKQLRSSQLDLY